MATRAWGWDSRRAPGARQPWEQQRSPPTPGLGSCGLQRESGSQRRVAQDSPAPARQLSELRRILFLFGKEAAGEITASSAAL